MTPQRTRTQNFALLCLKQAESNAMPTSAKILSSFFRSGRKISATTKPSLVTLSGAATEDLPLKQFVSALQAQPPTSSSSVPKCSDKPPKPRTSPARKPAIELSLPTSEREGDSGILLLLFFFCHNPVLVSPVTSLEK